jgi:hypothetical protein
MSLSDKAFMQETFERYLRIVASTGKDPVLQPPLRMTIALRSQKRDENLSIHHALWLTTVL